MSPESASRLIGPCCTVMRGGPEAPDAVPPASSATPMARSTLENLRRIAAMHLRFQLDALLAQPRDESSGIESPAFQLERYRVVRRDDLGARIDAQPLRRDAHGRGGAGQEPGERHIAAEIDLSRLVDRASAVGTNLPELAVCIAELHLDLGEERHARGGLLADIGCAQRVHRQPVLARRDEDGVAGGVGGALRRDGRDRRSRGPVASAVQGEPGNGEQGDDRRGGERTQDHGGRPAAPAPSISRSQTSRTAPRPPLARVAWWAAARAAGWASATAYDTPAARRSGTSGRSSPMHAHSPGATPRRAMSRENADHLSRTPCTR